MTERPDDRGDFTLCSRCDKNTLVIQSIGREHWAYCEDCKTKECVGENLFTGWRDQTAAEKAAGIAFLEDFEDISSEDTLKYLRGERKRADAGGD